MDEALDLTWDAMKPFFGDYFEAELSGLADACDLPVAKLRRVHMVADITKGSCSMFGAWGKATAKQVGNPLMQLRALDWDVEGTFRNFPQVTVYHPNIGNGHAFANIAWTGFIGSITGISSARVAISEIGVSFPDDTFGKESRFGIPFVFVLRDILQFDSSLTAAQKRLTTAKRTCDLILGVGDGNTKEFRSVQYSHSVANFYTDTNMEPQYDWHKREENLVYYGMDWLCPGYTQVLHDQLMKFYGNLTAENTLSEITAITQTGNLHIAVYDLTTMIVHLANARKDGASGPLNAFDRTFIRLDFNAIFAEKRI